MGRWMLRLGTRRVIIRDFLKSKRFHFHCGPYSRRSEPNNAMEAESGWNLSVSAPWTDETGTATAIHTIARALNEDLGLENRNSISRITVLKSSDPFVKDMTSLYPVTRRNGVHVTAGHVTDGGGFVFYSQKAA